MKTRLTVGGMWSRWPLLSIIVVAASFSTAAAVACSSHQFECANGHCVPHSWACDGEDDCGDGTDETPDTCRGKVDCAETEFRCPGGRCIPQRWQCDGKVDCDDQSDEDPKLCSLKNCTEEQFACKGRAGECVPLSWVCDFNADCSDGSDEEGCNATCTADEFTCRNGLCVQKRWVCDTEDDCKDGSDEGDHCPQVTCPPESKFSCGDNKCVPEHWRCDGEIDCKDGSDEQDCPPTTKNVTSPCKTNEIACHDGINCIHQTWRCDGDADCADGSDELNCTTSTCRPDQFRCLSDGLCVPAHLRCSGAAECTDSSDEADCADPTSALPTVDTANATADPACPPSTHFDCDGSGRCVPLAQVCDGHDDCGGGQDEPLDECHRDECATAAADCDHTCVDLPLGYRCDCRPGYQLVGNSTCTDVDECAQVGVCSQRCTNEKGGFKCECDFGYSRDPHDVTRCKADEGHAALLFTHKTDIRRFSLDRRDLTAVVNDSRSATALDFHFRTGMLFWSDVLDRRIYKAPIDEGQAVELVLQGHVVNSDGLAVDWIYDHLYWTDSVRNTIEVADFDGGMRQVLVRDNLKEPRAIAVDPNQGWMYWSDWGAAPRIERAGMDGSRRQVLVDSHVKWPNGITIDYQDGRLYWVDAKLHLIGSVSLDGSDRRNVLADSRVVRHPFSVSVFEDWVYWSDWDSQTIMRANKFNGSHSSAVTPYHSNLMVVHVYHAYRQPDGPNHCRPLNGRCSHMCLPTPQLAGKRLPRVRCACADRFRLADDGYTCLSNVILQTNTTSAQPTDPIIDPKLKDTAADGNATTTVPTTEVGGGAQDVLGGDSGAAAADGDDGTVAALIIGVVTAIVILVVLASLVIYRQFVNRNATSMNFDNPVYRKTTEDQFALQKNLHHNHHSNQPALALSRSYPAAVPGEETLQPLTSPGTNEYV